MTVGNEDQFYDDYQAKAEGWDDDSKGPFCKKCGASLYGYYIYDIPGEGLYCENCVNELLAEYKAEWEVV